MKYTMISNLLQDCEKGIEIKTRAYTNEEKEKLIDFMKSVEPCAVAGHVYDCIKQEEINIEHVLYENDGFWWTSQDIYHLEKYNAAVTQEFYDKVMK